MINILICENFKSDDSKFSSLKISDPPEKEIFAKEVNVKPNLSIEENLFFYLNFLIKKTISKIK